VSNSFGTAGTGRKSLDKIKDDLKFHPHQIDGIRTMARRTSFLLADEMGLGKSLQALTVAAVDFQRGWANRVLIVAPATLKGNWADEIEKHTSFTCHVLDGSPKQRAEQLAEFTCDILIINYEQVKPHLDALNAMKFDIVIFDEAHYIKNRTAARTKAAHGLKIKRAFVLTGSPMLNQVDDLWGLLHRVDPAAFPNYWRFVNRYAVKGGYMDKQIIGVKNKAELQDLVDRVMIRRLKKDVLDLPDKQRIPIMVDFHPQQEKYYRQAEDEMQIDLPSNPDPMEIENVLSKMLRLKQICGTPATIGAEDDSFKLDRAVEMCQEITHHEPDNPGEPVVVFTQFRGVLEAMRARLEAEGVPVYLLHGDVKISERSKVAKEWAKAKKPGVLLAMIQVAGVGLTLTAASKCIFLDKLWTPKLNEQAEDRLHRIGADKTRPVQIYEIIVRKSVEQRIETILRRKTKLFDTLIEGADSDWKQALIAAMTEEEGDD
jgi:SNF2 family DNA or RNA helicase